MTVTLNKTINTCEHGRTVACDACEWEDSPTLSYPSPAFPGHREGMIMNDLITLHSLLICNAQRGHIGLTCVYDHTVFPANHRGCQHR